MRPKLDGVKDEKGNLKSPPTVATITFERDQQNGVILKRTDTAGTKGVIRRPIPARSRGRQQDFRHRNMVFARRAGTLRVRNVEWRCDDARCGQPRNQLLRLYPTRPRRRRRIRIMARHCARSGKTLKSRCCWYTAAASSPHRKLGTGSSHTDGFKAQADSACPSDAKLEAGLDAFARLGERQGPHHSRGGLRHWDTRR